MMTSQRGGWEEQEASRPKFLVFVLIEMSIKVAPKTNLQLQTSSYF